MANKARKVVSVLSLACALGCDSTGTHGVDGADAAAAAADAADGIDAAADRPDAAADAATADAATVDDIDGAVPPSCEVGARWCDGSSEITCGADGQPAVTGTCEPDCGSGLCGLTDYGPVADALQTSTYTRFLSPDGTYFLQDNGGHSGFNYWWNAHGIDSFIDAYQRTRDGVYLTRAKNLLHGIRTRNGGTYNNTFYDDMAWLGLSSLRAYEATGDPEYLDVALYIWGRQKTGYSAPGVMSWNSSCFPGCKNSITNDTTVVLGARLLSIGQLGPADREMVETIYANVKAFMVDPATGAVWDGYNFGNGTADTARYSYNQGLFIGAALELYKLSGDAAYLADAKKTADWSITDFTVDGMIFGNQNGTGDGGLFKGILVRYLALLAREGDVSDADKIRYRNAVKVSGNVFHAKGLRRPEILAGPSWAEALSGTVTQYSVQLSAVFLAEAMAIIDYPMVYQHYYYEGRSTPLPPGHYTTAELAARGVVDNDITSLTVPPGWTVVLYENADFTGASLTVTRNDTFLDGGWNDRASSIVVTAPPSRAGVTLYQHCNFTGYSVALPLGNYALADLQRSGVPDNDVSSFQLAPGYRVELFEDDGFAGGASTAGANNGCLVGNGFNDIVSSLRLEFGAGPGHSPVK